MREQATLSRRALAAVLPIAALVGAASASAATMPPLASAGDAARIDAAAARCRGAHEALAVALDAYERALPAPHFTIDMTERRPWPFRATAERRLFDGATPKRGIDFLGNPAERYVATEETIERDLEWCPSEDRERRRLLFRMHRRARARVAKMEALEASFRLDELRIEVDAAERVLEALARELFETPATSMAEVLVQAKALSVYAEAITGAHTDWQAGKFGKQLAAGLQNVARAA